MRGNERFPGDQAEIVFCDPLVEYLETLPRNDQEQVLVEVLTLCSNPAGTHPLSNRGSGDNLAGLNVVEVLRREHRVVFSSSIVDGVGVVEVLCAGPRRAEAVYDIVNALIRTGKIADDEITEIWQALSLLDVVEESIGLDGWDYAPEPAPAGMQKAAVSSGLLPPDLVAVLSQDEIQAAMTNGWGADGLPDMQAALNAALNRARANAPFHSAETIMDRILPRCGEQLPRTGRPCIRRAAHPGPHRSTP